MADNKIYKIKGEFGYLLFPKGKQSDKAEFKISCFLCTGVIEGHEEIFEGMKYTFKGIMPKLSSTEEYTIHFKCVGTHPQYGNQYEIIYINAEYDIKNNDDAMKFLDRILTPIQIKNITDTISDPLKIMANGDIDELMKVPGIGEKTAQNILDKFNNTKDFSQVYIELAPYNFTQNMIQKLIQMYSTPDKIIDVVKNDIYQLTEMDGVGFLKADSCFLEGGGNPKSPKRLKGYIKHYLSELGENGNSWTPSNVFAKQIYDVFGNDLDKAIFGGVLKELEEDKIIRYDRENKRIGLSKYYGLEWAIARELKRISGGKNLEYDKDWIEVVSNIEMGQGWKYTGEQKEGIGTILDNSFVLVTGLAGSGKTTLINAVTAIYADRYSIIQTALSGCASQRIAQVSGYESATIHRTLGYIPYRGFTRNGENQLESDIIIIDEASMIGGGLFLSLLKAIKTGTKVIILGDWGQLESIGQANVFFDILDSNLPVVKLTQVHRQASASAIISKSKAIRGKKQLFDKDFRGREVLGELKDLELNIDNKDMLQGYFVKQYLLHSKRQGVENVLGITAMRERGQLSCYELNNIIQSKLDLNRDKSMSRELSKGKKYTFYVGDKVINVTNNYEMESTLDKKISIFNGNIGIVQSIIGGRMVVNFSGIGSVIYDEDTINQLELGYVITVHKSQGSQAHTVVFGIDFSAYTMLSNELLYTAITRAKSYCVMVGENAAIRKAITVSSSTNKNTYLRELLV